MTFYDRYISGENGRSVYADIDKLGPQAFNDAYAMDVTMVLTETFNRIVYNLKIIHAELEQIGYVFYDQPFISPSAQTNYMIKKLEEAVADFGFIPLSLKIFYRIVGGCNLAWDYNANPNLYWNCADPLQIDHLETVVNYVADNDWSEYMQDMIDDDDSEIPQIEISPDYLHKDNISGGPAYSIQLTKEPQVDSLFLNEEHNTTFIDYLRICMENCGFSKITNPQYQNTYQDFFYKIKPKLKPI